MTEVNGIYCSTRAMRIGPATNKKPATGQQYPKASYQNTQGYLGENGPNNTIIFVGGLDPSVSEDQLKQIFSQLGSNIRLSWGLVLQAERPNQIRPSGMVDIMDMLKDLKHMDIHLLPKTLTCSTGSHEQPGAYQQP
ncbi:Uncharacterized protein TCM_007468 [Theobroma cacao]|uniref:RRM domain-containing protein n=1 Tax=Theobroma cacao TaxID=3641 RepID=A0A061E2D2_THECC|nr:Uncharacterized protein TCM_007468 [Theobroma cacao]